MGGIAITYGVPLETLLAANGITDPRQVRAGQGLVIPLPGTTTSQEEASVASPSPAPDTSSSSVVDEGEAAGTGTPAPADTTGDALSDANKAMVIETALRLDQSVVVKKVTIIREPDRETILVVIETQGGTGSPGDETTLREAVTSFVYSYAADQRLDIGARYVLAQAQNETGEDSWYAAAAIDDIGLLTDSAINLSEFLNRIRIETASQ
jgi:LysM repeat protein